MGGAGGDGPSEACQTACATMGDCAIEQCAAYDDDAREQILEWCHAACDDIPSFASVANGTETCGDLVAFGRQTMDPAFAEQCAVDPGNVVENPECEAFGAKIVECMAETCAPAADNEAVLVGAYTHICNEAIANGNLAPENAQAVAGFACDQAPLSEIIAEQLAASADFCADGPLTDPAVCRAGCEAVSPCIPPESDGAALRDTDRCEQFCLTNPTFSSEVWACTAEADACGAVFECLQPAGPPPAIPECDPYGVRAAACLVEACPSVADIQESLVSVSTLLCNQIAADGAFQPADIADIAEADCADERIAGLVTFLTVDAPEADDDGALAVACEEGIVSIDTCRPACAVAAPCFPEGGDAAALRDPLICEYACAIDPNGPATWECIAEAEMCVDVGACFPMDGQ